MIPADEETALLAESKKVGIPEETIIVVQIYIPAICITLCVSSDIPEAPATSGIDIPCDLGVHVVAYREVVATIDKEIAKIPTVAIAWDEDASLLFGRIRKVSEGQTEGGRHTAHFHVDGTGDDLVIRDDDHLVKTEVVVGFVQIASGVLPTLVMHFTIGLFLGKFGMHIAFSVIGDDSADKAFSCFEIITNRITTEGIAAFRKYRLADDSPAGVFNSMSEHFHRSEIMSRIRNGFAWESPATKSMEALTWAEKYPLEFKVWVRRFSSFLVRLSKIKRLSGKMARSFSHKLTDRSRDSSVSLSRPSNTTL